MTYFLPGILTILLHVCHVNQNDNLIDWSTNRRLTWGDFQAEPPKTPTAAALTSTTIKVDFGYFNETLTYHIHCRFDKSSSWGRVKNDYVLSHEQGHFDIAEIFARKLNEALGKYRPESQNIPKDVNKIYQDMMKKYYERQDEYDKETNFSMDKKKQEEWLKIIENELTASDKLSNYH
jgi:predicted AlkP superfamily phosphohydrolase/phosphomutase